MKSMWTVAAFVLVLTLAASFSGFTEPAEAALGQAALQGNSERGRDLYQSPTAYKCYACHGFDGQTGNPQLVPMGFDQAGFINLVQRGVRGMPAYNDVSAQDLADIYAYLNTIRLDAPEASSIPLLNNLLQQIEQAR